MHQEMPSKRILLYSRGVKTFVYCTCRPKVTFSSTDSYVALRQLHLSSSSPSKAPGLTPLMKPFLDRNAHVTFYPTQRLNHIVCCILPLCVSPQSQTVDFFHKFLPMSPLGIFWGPQGAYGPRLRTAGMLQLVTMSISRAVKGWSHVGKARRFDYTIRDPKTFGGCSPNTPALRLHDAGRGSIAVSVLCRLVPIFE